MDINTNFLSKHEVCSTLEKVRPGQVEIDKSKSYCSKKVVFERLTLLFLEEIHSYSTDERLYEFLEYKPFKKINETKLFVQKLLDRVKKVDDCYTAFYWVIRDKFDKQVIGTASLSNIDVDRYSTEWGYAIDPKRWGEGHILDVQESLKFYVFEVLNFNRLYGLTMLSNERTRNSLMAAGMKEEGILRQSHRKNNKFYDGWKYSMLREDYFRLKESTTSSNYEMSDEKFLFFIEEILGERVTHETQMGNSVNWDSLSHMTLMEAIAEKFSVELTPELIQSLTSVRNISNFLFNRKT